MLRQDEAEKRRPEVGASRAAQGKEPGNGNPGDHDRLVTTPLPSENFRQSSEPRPVYDAAARAAARAAIEAALARFPDLCRAGFRINESDADFLRLRASMLSNDVHDCLDQFIRAVCFLKAWPRSPAPNLTMITCNWAHLATRWHTSRGEEEPYVSNGMLIAAAHHLCVPGIIPKERGSSVYLYLRSIISHICWDPERFWDWHFGRLRHV